MASYEGTTEELKKIISITSNGNSILKIYGKPGEVKTFFDSVEDKDEQIVTTFFDGDDVIEHKSTGMVKAMGSYGENVGKSFRDFQKSLAARDARVLDAHTARGAGAGDYPSLSSVESYEDPLNKSLYKFSSAQCESNATDATAAGRVEYPSLSSVSSYDKKLGKRFRDLKMKLSGKSSFAALEEPPPAAGAPPSPTSVMHSLHGVKTPT